MTLYLLLALCDDFYARAYNDGKAVPSAGFLTTQLRSEAPEMEVLLLATLVAVVSMASKFDDIPIIMITILFDYQIHLNLDATYSYLNTGANKSVKSIGVS